MPSFTFKIEITQKSNGNKYIYFPVKFTDAFDIQKGDYIIPQEVLAAEDRRVLIFIFQKKSNAKVDNFFYNEDEYYKLVTSDKKR